MFPLFAGAMAGLAAGVDAITGHSANQASAAQANANREFARHAHEIEVADLKKAGLNPMLSFRGSGSQISGGAMPTIRPITENTGSKVAQGVLLEEQRQNLQASTAAQHADARLKNADAQIREDLGKPEKEADIALKGQHRATSAAEEKRIGIEVERATAEIRNLGETFNNLQKQGRLTEQHIREGIHKANIAQLDYHTKARTMENVIREINSKAINVNAENSAAWVKGLAAAGFSKEDIVRIFQAAGIGYLLRR